MIYEYHKLDEHASFLNQKCVDYALYVEGDNLLYLTELKGSDLNHAYEQVLETFKMLQRDIKLKRGDARGRIVIGKVKRPALKSPEIKRLIKECKTEKLDVLCQTQQIIEDI